MFLSLWAYRVVNDQIILTNVSATETTPLSIDALILKKRGNVFATGFFKQGLFEVQDAGSQAIAPILRLVRR